MKEICFDCKNGKRRLEMVAPSVSSTVAICRVKECSFKPNRRTVLRKMIYGKTR